MGGWRVGETRLNMTWRLAAGRENADTWTYLQNTPVGLSCIGQEHKHITGLHLGRGESLPPAFACGMLHGGTPLCWGSRHCVM
jgi:hypothetical protein